MSVKVLLVGWDGATYSVLDSLMEQGAMPFLQSFIKSGARAGLRTSDLLLTAAGQPVEKAQDLQRLMFDDAIGRPLAITVFRNGALVDVIAEPEELVAA